ncbi:glycine oxidase ThiO [Bacillus sp. KH172YL63]|uniref:glycine oxidase ThiO n=1 Tax=Bacillus sp. KH172YL63 TaxID=2709784 RepID=UPI0013E48B3E|nr:glycine oxidase ThiO [Bacillus sp. KH172YL63]BCB03821.1 glycine oxidase ThiO [Bacillus sp. KH172YL63]
MGKQYDVLIIGGGVIGCSIAYQLAKRGKKVLILEKDRIAGKASSAAAGMLGVHTELSSNSSLYQLAKASRSLYPSLAEELTSICGIDIELVQNGMLKLARSEEEAHKLMGMHAQSDRNEGITWLSGSQLSAMEPNLSDQLTGGLWIPDDGNVSAPKLSNALGLAAAKMGAKILEYTEVSTFLKEDDRIIGVETNRGFIYAENTIMAAGAWSGSLLDHLDMNYGAYPVKGECFSVTAPRSLVRATLFTDGCYIVPKVGGRLLIGATEKPHSFDENISLDSLLHLMEKATALVPDLKYAHWDRAWAGIRPQTELGIPLMEKSREWKGLFAATGHYRNGILLAPITGVLMADLIEGRENPLLNIFRRSGESGIKNKRSACHST